MKAASNAKMESLFRDPTIREQIRQQVKKATGAVSRSGKQTITVRDAKNNVFRVNIVAAKVPS